MKPETTETRLTIHRRECVNTECLTCALGTRIAELEDALAYFRGFNLDIDALEGDHNEMLGVMASQRTEINQLREQLECARAGESAALEQLHLADASTEIIANRQAEINRLRARVNELERELAELKARKGGSE